MLKKIIILFVAMAMLQQYVQANDGLKISVVTCAPGSQLYSIFGHTALRVTNTKTGTDVVFNYGTFDFDDPNFYSKFVKGKLDYFLSVQDAASFMYAYQAEGRTVWQQQLILDSAQQQQLVQFLQNNILPNNKYYKYDFIKDNCTTRIVDIALSQYKNALKFVALKPFEQQHSYRNMLHFYLDRGNMPWSKLGIDILLGSKIDKAANWQQANFLPENLMQTLQSNSTIAMPASVMVQSTLLNTSSNSLWSKPIFLLSILSFLIILFSFLNHPFFAKLYVLLSNVVMLITGLVGVLLMFMWLATNHQTCANNYNLLWALPFNILVPFARQKQLVVKYSKIAFVIHCLVLLTWVVLPQQLNVALLPVIVLQAFNFFKIANSQKYT